jgi:hypothetical protein
MVRDHVKLVPVPDVSSQFLRAGLLRTSHLIVQKCEQAEEDCVRLFEVYAVWTCCDDDLLIGRALKYFYQLLKKSITLYRLLLSEAARQYCLH